MAARISGAAIRVMIHRRDACVVVPVCTKDSGSKWAAGRRNGYPYCSRPSRRKVLRTALLRDGRFGGDTSISTPLAIKRCRTPTFEGADPTTPGIPR